MGTEKATGEKIFHLQPGIRGEVRLIERAFNIGPDMLTETFEYYKDRFEKLAS